MHIDGREGNMQRWEYCKLVQNYEVWMTRDRIEDKECEITLSYYRTEGTDVNTLYRGPSLEFIVTDNTLARLGEEGWELVTVRTEMRENSQLREYLLKRPKE
jgi:hypothetical protein